MFGPVGHDALASITPPGSMSRTGSGTLVAPAALITTDPYEELFVLTPRPPVALHEVDRATATGGWASIAQVREYTVPATATESERTISARYVLGRLTAASPTGVEGLLTLRVIDVPTKTVRTLIPQIVVPASGYVDLPLQSAVLGAQEVLQVLALTSADIHVTASYVNSTVEPYDVL